MTTKRAGSLPFLNPVGDGLELMKKMWGFAGLPSIPTAGNLATMAARIPQQLPSMLAPTLDVNELEKRIADLRAVEQWLELNAGILRTTIQTLEVQRATIATLKGIGGAMWAPMLSKPGASPAPPPEVALGLAAMKADESKAATSSPPPALPSATRKQRKRANKNATAPSAGCRSVCQSSRLVEHPAGSAHEDCGDHRQSCCTAGDKVGQEGCEAPRSQAALADRFLNNG